MSQSSSLGVLFAVGSLVVWFFFGRNNQLRKQPPGPPPHPFVGHTFQIPTEKTWKYFERLWHQYGPIFRLSLAGDEIIVLNKGKDAEELLGRRAKNYSSRKQLIFAGKYQSNTKRMVLLPYGEELRKHRAAVHYMLQSRAKGGYEAVIDSECWKFIRSVLNHPTYMHRHASRFAASLMFTLVYGKQITEENESDLDAVLRILEGVLQETYPGSHLVDTFPSLDLLPDFLSPWRKKAIAKHQNEIATYSRLVLDVKDRMEKGDPTESCISRIWEQQSTSSEKLDLEEICYISGAVTEAGTDTTSGSIMWLTMALILYPETLKKAHAEIDAFFKNSDVLPTFEHMKYLPYCCAVVKESLRWNTSAAGGFPHLSEEDDEYNGYLIKGGTMVIPCIYNMHHNEEEFLDPFSFKPERWIERDGDKIYEKITEGHYGFGFGRRKCPGNVLAVNTIWLAAVRMMWAFNFGPEFDEDGNALPIDPENCTSGMTSNPLKFPMRVWPRSQDRVTLILHE